MRFVFKTLGIILILSLLRVQLLSAVTFTPEEVEHLEVQEVLKQQQVKKSLGQPIIRFTGDERVDALMRYTLSYCQSILGSGPIIKNGRNYSCEKQVETRTNENGAWGWRVISPTSDYGICQLHYKYHKDFIDDKERFEDPINQIHYCMGVRQNALERGVMPRYAYR